MTTNNINEAFVYCWTNLTNNKKYVWYHKGTLDDGYICLSRSKSFWNDWKTCQWSRQIIAVGSENDCIELEKKLLFSIDIQSDEWYNNSRGGSIVFTEEVRAKMRRKFSVQHRKKLSEAKKGNKLSEEHKRKLNEGRRNAPKNLTSESMKRAWAKKKAAGFKWSDQALKNIIEGNEKKVTIRGIEYESRKDASKKLGVFMSTIDRWRGDKK